MRCPRGSSSEIRRQGSCQPLGKSPVPVLEVIGLLQAVRDQAQEPLCLVPGMVGALPNPQSPEPAQGHGASRPFRKSSLGPCFGGGGLSSATWGPSVAQRGSWGVVRVALTSQSLAWRWAPSQGRPYGSAGCTGVRPVFTDPSGLGRVTQQCAHSGPATNVSYLCALRSAPEDNCMYRVTSGSVRLRKELNIVKRATGSLPAPVQQVPASPGGALSRSTWLPTAQLNALPQAWP